MAVSLEPKVQPLVQSRFEDVAPATLRSVSLNRADSMSSMQNDDSDKTEAPKTATKEESSRGFCGTLFDVLTAPFRCVAYCVTAVWNFICCKDADEADKVDNVKTKAKTDKTKETDEEDDKPVRVSAQNNFEKAVLRKEFDSDKCERAFSDLRGEEKKRMSHFLWIAMGKSEPKDFVAKEAIGAATEAQMKKAVELSLAARKLERFHAATKSLDFSKDKDEDKVKHKESATKKHWDPMSKKGTDREKEAGETASTAAIEATWLVRGGTGVDGKPIAPRAMTYGNTVEEQDKAAHEAVERLSKNKMMLLKDHEAREAMEHFADTLAKLSAAGDLASGALKAAYLDLKEKSEDAAKLLAFAVGCALGKNPKAGERYILNTDAESHIGTIVDIAKNIVKHEQTV